MPSEWPGSLATALATVLGFFVAEGRCAKEGTGWASKASQTAYENDTVIALLNSVMEEVFGDRVCADDFKKNAEPHELMRGWAVHSLAFAEWLQEINFGTDSGNQQIPTVIVAAPKVLKIEFFRALFGSFWPTSIPDRRTVQIVPASFVNDTCSAIRALQVRYAQWGLPPMTYSFCGQ
jgi:hypothetical protein